ncbi:DUF6291 domain-containing protein [Proteiniphilum sp. X52]|uniref:DUF6291 domain-containing protein n=1 Tax=Proteiniphilum sp. X52 TaxID=2382159 RepID=UPI0011CEC77C|nr:DUF6291 domain-containing protein [Proteiniphilum sp. X52]
MFYEDWKNAISGLPDDVRLDIYESIIEYAISGNIRGLKPLAKVAFNFIKTDIDRDTERYMSIVERNKENGKKGGRPKGTNNPKNPLGYLETQNNPKNLDNDNEDDNDISSDEDIKKKKFSFKKAMLDYGFDSGLVDEWLIIRRSKKAVNSEIAFNGFISEIEKTGEDKNKLLKHIVLKQWRGFEAQWLNNEQNFTKYETNKRNFERKPHNSERL